MRISDWSSDVCSSDLGRLTVGTLSQFVLYAVLGGGSVGALAETWNELQKAAGGMGRIGELLAERSGIAAPAQPRSLPVPVRGELRFEGVTFHYPSRPDAPALEDFSLHVAPGETVALVGPSGAGKSTVFAMLLRFHDPQRGRIDLDGIDIRTLDPAELRGTVALVPQQPTIFASSARENIRYGRPEAGDADIEAAARSAEAHDFLSFLPAGSDEHPGETGARPSGAQHQPNAIPRPPPQDTPVHNPHQAPHP